MGGLRGILTVRCPVRPFVAARPGDPNNGNLTNALGRGEVPSTKTGGGNHPGAGMPLGPRASGGQVRTW
jgi:hypothetical protein